MNATTNTHAAEVVRTVHTHSESRRIVAALRDEAAVASDLPVWHAAGVLLGREEPIDGFVDAEDRYGGGGWSRSDLRAVAKVDSLEVARIIVAEAIESARAAATE